MFVNELDSFVQKFHQLRKAGLTAHLDLETHAGHAWVGLRVQLGHVPGPAQHSSPHQRRGPAYQRRQLRRQAAQAAQVAQADQAAEEVRDAHGSNDVTPAAEVGAASVQSDVSTAVQEVRNEDVANDNEKSAEKSESDFPCLVCDFKSNWQNGLEIHMARKHCNIAQVDGNNTIGSEDTDDDDKYAGTRNYWKTGRLGSAFQCFLDANNIIENSNLKSDVKVIEKEKVLEARKLAFGKHFRHFPPWS
jgi:hypothetical protein